MPHRRFPAVMAPGGISNGLLAALPATDLDFLRPELAMVALDQDAVLSRAGEPIEYVFFPHGGAISLMIDMADGQTVATAAVGREGAVGMLSVLGRTVGRYRNRPCGGHRRADLCVAISRRFQPQSGDPEFGPESRQGDADTVPARLGLQCAAPGRSPHGSLATPASRPHRPRHTPAHPAGAFANTRCTTNDGDALDAQSARAWGDQV